MSKISSVKGWLDSGSINIFGMPFAGKDTQAELLAAEFSGVRLSGGEILRNSPIPIRVREIIDAGGLAPTQDYITIVLPYLSREEFKGKPLILSSVGRWHGEEDGVMQALNQSNHPLKAVIYLSINETTISERLKVALETGDRGDRVDDSEEKLTLRLQEFRNKTLPVIEYYRQKGLLIEVDASGHVIDVTRDIIDALATRATG
jgi:adenylate kinase